MDQQEAALSMPALVTGFLSLSFLLGGGLQLVLISLLLLLLLLLWLVGDGVES